MTPFHAVLKADMKYPTQISGPTGYLGAMNCSVSCQFKIVTLTEEWRKTRYFSVSSLVRVTAGNFKMPSFHFI